MSDTDQNAEPTVTAPSELETLKQRALILGISHHPSIGAAKLKEKIIEAMKETIPVDEGSYAEEPVPAAAGAPRKKSPESRLQRDTRLRREAGKLVRVVVTCMNPQKREWEGEIFTASNSIVSMKKFIPFNNEEGWHIPQFILNIIEERKCQIWVNKKNERGQTTKVSKMIKEFQVTNLTPLTLAEIKELAKEQALGRTIE